MQYIYDSLGYITAEFYHTNGIKEGIYKALYDTVGKYNIEIMFCNDIQVGDLIIKRNK